ncbi:hypothetical protein [Azospirillum himalayense]|uniref:Uncharacterized protein n=1 Tax=Azospirillum himalayense TaxID=654847 RepID=A0ABW0FXG3_9PROT
MEDKTTEALAQIDHPGRVTWHSSGEDEGPDVGLSFGLGNGSSLYVGEISRAHHAAEAETAGHLGDDTGWWIILHDAEVARVIGKTAEPGAGRALIDALSEAFPRRSSVQEAAPATAADGLADAAIRLLSDARYFARRWSDPKAVADYIDEQMACRGISAAPTAQGQDADDTIKRRWIIIREPGNVPVTKIPKQSHDGAREFLRECAAIYPAADITLAELTWNNDLWVSDGREALTIDDAMAEYTDADDWTDRVPEPQTAGCEFTMSYADEPNSIVCRNGHMIDIDIFTEGFDESDFFHPCPKCNADAYAAWKAENGDEDEDNDDSLPSAPSAGEATKPLTHCAAGKDGECNHPDCPQLRDGEPAKSRRHCPLDTDEED